METKVFMTLCFGYYLKARYDSVMGLPITARRFNELPSEHAQSGAKGRGAAFFARPTER
jgi:hypothetical protein